MALSSIFRYCNVLGCVSDIPCFLSSLIELVWRNGNACISGVIPRIACLSINSVNCLGVTGFNGLIELVARQQGRVGFIVGHRFIAISSNLYLLHVPYHELHTTFNIKFI